MTHPLILLMRLLAPWPLGWLRALGAGLGRLLFVLARSRRHVVLVNLALCFPELPEAERLRLARAHFVGVAQSFLDRAWLWHGSPALLSRRLRLQGSMDDITAAGGVVMLAPHFVGLDAGAMVISLQQAMQQVTVSSIYVPQRNAQLDTWIREGRGRFLSTRLYSRHEGIKQILTGLRAGEKLYLLPDMDFGPAESVFVPFCGVPAATVTSLARFARLGRARVVTVATRMTEQGYVLEVGPVWQDFPTDDVVADTARMNREIEALARTMPEQYYWVHKRFKTRPEGEAGVY